MFTQCKHILIYDIVIILLLYFDTMCAKNPEKLAGIVENITVYALEDESYLKSNNIFKPLKLNISWMPPKGEREPSSYSIVVTNIPKETDINGTECIESSAFYTIHNNSQFSLLVPQNKLLNGMSEMQILPNCTYKIQVYANPRVKPIGNLPEVIYTVPECIDHKCSCMSAKNTLPIPKVSAIQTKTKVVINWNITSNNSYVYSYIISIGIPLLTSKAGHIVYNITKISNVISTTNTFIWDLSIDDQYIKVKNGYKILVMAIDYQGCLGIQGDFTITTTSKPEISQESINWLLLGGVAICIMLVLACVSFVLIHARNGYQLMWSSRSSRQRMPVVSSCKSQWPKLVFQKRNILYVEQPEEICCKIYENDELEVPYKYINLMYQLGKGHFGRVYLASLNNNEETLVAIKMSQCSDISNESEAREQLLEEIKTMKAAGSHPHLVSLIGYCTLPDKPICILLEYMEGGDLLAYLHSRKRIKSDQLSSCSFEKPLPRYVNIAKKDRNEEMAQDLHDMISKQQFMKFALDIAKGMEHLEAKGITHRDLAARNILLTSDLTLKVSDFGLSRNGIYVINNVASKIRQLPIRWMSPEAVCNRAFSSKSDIWSFAIVLWEIGTLGSFPYSNIRDDELLSYLTQDNQRLKCPNTISQDIYKIMCSCWNTVPQDRPSFAQLVLDLQTLKEPLYSIHGTSNPCYTLLSH